MVLLPWKSLVPSRLKQDCQAETRGGGRVLLLTAHHKQEGCGSPALLCLALLCLALLCPASLPALRTFHYLTAAILPWRIAKSLAVHQQRESAGLRVCLNRSIHPSHTHQSPVTCNLFTPFRNYLLRHTGAGTGNRLHTWLERSGAAARESSSYRGTCITANHHDHADTQVPSPPPSTPLPCEIDE